MKNRFEIFIGQMMALSIAIAWAVIVYGGALYLRRHGQDLLHDGTFSGEASRLTNVRTIFHTAKMGMPRSIIQLGLLIVVAGQLLRVFLTGVLFAQKRDWIFVGMSLLIFLILLHTAF